MRVNPLKFNYWLHFHFKQARQLFCEFYVKRHIWMKARCIVCKHCCDVWEKCLSTLILTLINDKCRCIKNSSGWQALLKLALGGNAHTPRLSWLLMRELAAHFTVNLSLSQQKRSVLIDVRQESFSALCPLVLTSVIVKSIKNWNPALGPDDMTHQMKKQRKAPGKMSEIIMFTWVLCLH